MTLPAFQKWKDAIPVQVQAIAQTATGVITLIAVTPAQDAQSAIAKNALPGVLQVLKLVRAAKQVIIFKEELAILALQNSEARVLLAHQANAQAAIRAILLKLQRQTLLAFQMIINSAVRILILCN